ncbi:MAG: hypothetical protein A2X13_06930 [Bacteroidetes bacterium GWC2_33_15]|nr:MAG: hypothetical protein A2X10_02360 [Bacteroidetes bacterium GWA2_33_15]OFX52515.1 MAG: hypothetical protein A2X13_06930 [Bacteroidetes bacterium GWC2_33_15]OFX65575.1 MAG: hypothetical protein A2X15_15045 [Bacteroidetes bacterium GWB2_32_14]OFX67597.1 MAG: hypothetical protein A2X14_11765 [Bacteroidetes bacterium GWD2_33_33]HAN18356.1 SIMPL domain-containing protein [Bacteroidales bacterium]
MKTNLTAILFSVAIIISSLLLGNAYMNRTKTEETISVTGLGEKDFISDLIVWDGSFTKENMDLKQAYAGLEKDKEIIEDYLQNNGIDNKEIVFSAVQTIQNRKQLYSSDGRYMGDEFAGYILNQSIQISSKEVEKIETISRKITELLNKGIQFYSEPPRYYYTKLADLKIELISKATEDARIRAEKISEKSGSKIKKLVSAQMGIFQITGQNSNEEFSWGGTFNTASKEKTASITMKLTYRIK